jgi:hypothetical protein
LYLSLEINIYHIYPTYITIACFTYKGTETQTDGLFVQELIKLLSRCGSPSHTWQQGPCGLERKPSRGEVMEHL